MSIIKFPTSGARTVLSSTRRESGERIAEVIRELEAYRMISVVSISARKVRLAYVRRLTPRMIDVFKLLGHATPTRQIREQLCLTPAALSNIYSDLRGSFRAPGLEAVRKAAWLWLVGELEVAVKVDRKQRRAVSDRQTKR